MKKMLIALPMCLMLGGVIASENEIDPRVEKRLQELIDAKFANAILMTTKECGSFGPKWEPYEPIAGRFPLAAGRGTDEREEGRSFFSGDTGGEYEHQLTVAEMPTHNHDYNDVRSKKKRGDFGDDEPTELRTDSKKTELRGGGEAHNNMPPYLALNFCHNPCAGIPVCPRS